MLSRLCCTRSVQPQKEAVYNRDFKYEIQKVLPEFLLRVFRQDSLICTVGSGPLRSSSAGNVVVKEDAEELQDPSGFDVPEKACIYVI